MSFISGLMGGFHEASTARRVANQADFDKQDARESALLTSLANSPDVEPEVRTAATAAMLEKALGNKPPKGGFMSYLMGTAEAPTHGAVGRVLDMVRGGGSAAAPTAPAASQTPPISQTPSTPQPQGPVLQPPPQAAPAGASGALNRPAAGQPNGPVTPAQVTPPPTVTAPAAAARPTLDRFVQTGPVATVGAPPQAPAAAPAAPATPPRPIGANAPRQPGQILIPEAEQVRRAAIAKSQGDVEGEVAGLIASGVSEADARELVKASYLHRATAGSDTWAEGNTIPDKTSPTGWSQQLYRRNNPSQVMTIPAQAPLTPEVRAQNATATTTARLNAEAAGPLSTAKSADVTMALQDDWRKAIAPIQEMRRAFSVMQTGLQRFDADKLGAIEAIRVTFEKVLDPNSVVREAEYARQTGGLSVGGKLQGLMQKWFEGGGDIPKEALVEMVETARQFIQNMEGWTDQERNRLDDTARFYGLQPRLITGTVDPKDAHVGNGPAGGAPGGNIAGNAPPPAVGATTPAAATAPTTPKGYTGAPLAAGALYRDADQPGPDVVQANGVYYGNVNGQTQPLTKVGNRYYTQ